MVLEHHRRNFPVRHGLHPAVYGALAGCAVWIVAAAWIFYASEAYAALQIAIVAVFASVFLLVPLWLSRLSRARREAGSFSDWLNADIEIIDGTIKGRTALIMILSAPAAATAGITLVSLVAYLTAGHSA